MARVYREVTPRHIRDDDIVDDGYDAVDTTSNILERVVYLIGGILLALLALRFLLSLLGANTTNGFANFIYDVTLPFVRPFFGLFNYQPQFGVSRFEFETLIAMVVYGMVVALLARLVSIGRRYD